MQPKRLVKQLLLHLPGVRQVCLAKSRNLPRIFMYHRFSAGGETGMTREIFSWQLKIIKKTCHPITLAELCGPHPWKAVKGKALVVITVDDGYLDFFIHAFPLLKEHCVPATFFATVNFTEGTSWFWFDKIRFILQVTQYNKVNISFRQNQFNFTLPDKASKEAAWHSLANCCLALPETVKEPFVHIIAQSLNVTLPTKPPADFYAASWEQLAEMAANGIEIGSHTLSHPVLSLLDAKTMAYEVAESKKRLEDKLQKKIQTIAYPFGTIHDYNELTVQKVQDAGYTGAVVAHSGLPSQQDPYILPRLGSSNDKIDFLWKIYGMEYLMMHIRRKNYR